MTGHRFRLSRLAALLHNFAGGTPEIGATCTICLQDTDRFFFGAPTRVDAGFLETCRYALTLV